MTQIMIPISRPADFRYMPILKAKLGERRALSTQRERDKESLWPLAVISPAGDYDREIGRRLEPSDHLRDFGTRMASKWRRRPVFVDAEHVDDERHRAAETDHPLTVLIEYARKKGVMASPATSLHRTPEYQAAVARFARHYAAAAVCVRLTPGDLESPTLAADLIALTTRLGCQPDRVVLVIDFGGSEIAVDDDLVGALIDRVNHLPSLHRWAHVVLASTAFPSEFGPQKAATASEWPRNDWQLYLQVSQSPDLLRPLVYGDYAVEYPRYQVFPPGIPARARLRYSTSTTYLAEHGTTTKKPHGYAAIFPVADALAARTEFAGAAYSQGDAWIANAAARGCTSGNASTWRWAATDHHLCLTLQLLRALVGGVRTTETPTPAIVRQPALI